MRMLRRVEFTRLYLENEQTTVMSIPEFLDSGDILNIYAVAWTAPVLIELYRVNFDEEKYPPTTKVFYAELANPLDELTEAITIIQSTSYFFRATCLKPNQTGCRFILTASVDLFL